MNNVTNKTWGLLALIILFFQSTSYAQDEDLYSFDVDEFTKKTWEWKGIFSFSATQKQYNQDSVLYPIKISGNEDNSQETESVLELESRWDWEWSRLFLSGAISGLRSTIPENDKEDSVLREAYWQLAEWDPHNIEIGKRVLRWGKGYAFNPVALMERTKSPEDPEASREGLWIAQGIWLPGALPGFDTSSVNLVYLPIREGVNDDYQSDIDSEAIWGAKLYGLIDTTDLGLYAVRWEENKINQWGVDFASNLSVNFEIHGEYVATSQKESNTHEVLLGLRYLTDADVTWIAEAFFDSDGLTQEESRALFKNIENSTGSERNAYLSQIQQQSTINRHYGYIKVSVKEPFEWLYFTPSVAWLGNMDDQSSNITTQLSYTPSDNWTLLFSWQHLIGGRYSQYGENVVGDKAEISTAYNF